jgi:hypothetical protein
MDWGLGAVVIPSFVPCLCLVMPYKKAKNMIGKNHFGTPTFDSNIAFQSGGASPNRYRTQILHMLKLIFSVHNRDINEIRPFQNPC